MKGNGNLKILDDGTIVLYQQSTNPPIRYFHPRSLKQTGQQVLDYAGPCSSDYPLPLTADGKILYVSRNDKTLRSINVKTGKTMGIIRLPGTCSHYALSANGAVLTIRGSSQQFYDARTGRHLATFRVGHCGILSPSGRFFIDSERRAGIRVWSVATGRVLGTLGPEFGGGSDIAMSPDEKAVSARTSKDGKNFTYVFWDTATGRKLGTLNFDAKDDVSLQGGRLKFSPDGTLVSLLNINGRLRIYAFPSLQLLGDTRIKAKGGKFLSFELSPTEPLVVGLLAPVTLAKWTELVVWDYSKALPAKTPPKDKADPSSKKQDGKQKGRKKRATK